MKTFRYLFLFIASMIITIAACLPDVPIGSMLEPSFIYESRQGKGPGSASEKMTPPSPPLKLIVKATAYNAVPEQTDSTPDICAWGDKIRPDVIAISRDLEDMGLTRGKEVYIKGYGKKIVLDRMHSRKRNQIDLYMEKYDDAIQFGVKELEISWYEEDGRDDAVDG